MKMLFEKEGLQVDFEGRSTDRSGDGLSAGGTLMVTARASREGKAVPTNSIGGLFWALGQTNGRETTLTPVLPEQTYPAT